VYNLTGLCRERERLMPLKGETVLVTGGGVRVGEAITRAVFNAGAKVAIHCFHHQEEAEFLADELDTERQRICVVHGDLMRPQSVPSIFDQVETHLGPITALVNNAGRLHVTPLHKLDIHEVEALFALNAKAPLYTMSEMAKRAPQKGGIVNIVDTNVDRAWVDHVAYCASKASLLAATRVAARELAPRIRVNALSPGTVALRPDERGDEARLLRRIPLNVIGNTLDIGAAAVFLLSSDYITGAHLRVDGGSGLM
jgi:pteridine reductase